MSNGNIKLVKLNNFLYHNYWNGQKGSVFRTTTKNVVHQVSKNVTPM